MIVINVRYKQVSKQYEKLIMKQMNRVENKFSFIVKFEQKTEEIELRNSAFCTSFSWYNLKNLIPLSNKKKKKKKDVAKATV